MALIWHCQDRQSIYWFLTCDDHLYWSLCRIVIKTTFNIHKMKLTRPIYILLVVLLFDHAELVRGAIFRHYRPSRYTPKCSYKADCEFWCGNFQVMYTTRQYYNYAYCGQANCGCVIIRVDPEPDPDPDPEDIPRSQQVQPMFSGI